MTAVNPVGRKQHNMVIIDAVIKFGGRLVSSVKPCDVGWFWTT